MGNHRVTIGDEWLDHLDHVPGGLIRGKNVNFGLVQLDEDSVMELSQSEELQDLLWLWCKLSDTK